MEREVSVRGRRLVAGWLLGVHALLVLHCTVEDFATYDEIGNLAAGVAYWEYGTYYLYNVNPPLTKLLAALPVVLARPDSSGVASADIPGQRLEREVGEQFARDNADRYHTLVILARLAGLGWSLLGAWLVYRWAGELWGANGGLLAMAVWCFEPNVITHAHLLNADLAATVAGAGAAYAFRRYLLEPSWGRAYVAGIALGVAQLCKFTLVVLYPIWIVLWIACRVGSRGGQPSPAIADDGSESGGGSEPRFRRARLVGWPRGAAQLALVFAICLFTINLGYEFAGSGRRLGDLAFVSQTFRGGADVGSSRHGNRFAGTWLGRLPMPLPEAYLRGIDVQRRDFEIYRSRYSYLGGQWRQGVGWWHYYLYAAAVKVPLGVLALLLLSILWPWRGRWAVPCRGGWRELLILWLPALAVLALASSQRSLQSHFRYVLPMFPFVIVFLGRAGAIGTRAVRADGGRSVRSVPAAMRSLIGGLLIWAAASYLFVHPYSLGYFNELGGGPHGGHNHLLGSNIDWGQDLFRLRRWLAQHPEAADLKMAYFNRIDARLAGLEWDVPPLGVSEATPADPEAAEALGPQPGYYAVSVRFVRGNQAGATDGRGGYRFAPFRSYEYFRHFEPIGKAGYSIFIYHITPEQANAVRARYGLPPLASAAG